MWERGGGWKREMWSFKVRFVCIFGAFMKVGKILSFIMRMTNLKGF